MQDKRKPKLYLQQKSTVNEKGRIVEYGRFDTAAYMAERIETAPKNAVFVETGVYNGQSIIYFLEQSNILGRKDLVFYGIDTYNQSKKPVTYLYKIGLAIQVFSLSYGEDAFLRCNLLQCDSIRFSKYFDDKGVYHLYLNDKSDFAHVSNEVNAWNPKIADGGYLSGHEARNGATLKSIYEGIAVSGNHSFITVDKNSYSIKKSQNITTGVPTTDVPTTDVPTTDVPTTDVPTTDVPTTDVPTTDVPTTDVIVGGADSKKNKKQ